MKWKNYYEKFYDWSESTQLNGVYSLSDFIRVDEIIEIAENFDEKGASKLIKKALSQGVYFNSQEIINVCEYVDKETTILLIKQCKDKLKSDQIDHLQEYTMLFQEDILALLNYNIVDLPWSAFYIKFFQLEEKQQILATDRIDDFGDEYEVVDIAMSLPRGKYRYKFIKNAINKKIVFSNENIQLLVDRDESIASLFGITTERQPKAVKLGFFEKLGLGLMVADTVDYLMNKDKD